MDNFPHAAVRYWAFLETVFDRVAEDPPLIEVAARMPELELQSLWFAGAFGRDFRSNCDRKVRIVQFGHWNHGSGPDFTETAVEIDGELVAGDIEIDPEVRDWERHGHSRNPDFNRVVLHVFPKPEKAAARLFTQTQDHRNVVQVELDLASLTKGRRGEHQPEAKLGRCSAPLSAMDDVRLESLIEGAAQFRLQTKITRISATAELHGPEEALYQGIAEALGYRPNKLPMRVLSQRLPILKLLDAEAVEREASWFGSAGFLEREPFESADSETQTYLRTLWEHWWKQRGATSPIPDLAWKLSGIRPANHPQRRIAAMVELMAGWERFSGFVPKPGEDPKPNWPKRVREVLANLQHTYWSHHYTLRSKAVAKPMALIGKDRISDILGNVLFPFAISAHSSEWAAYRELPNSVENEKLRRAKIRLFGEATGRKKQFKKFYQQQALLQIFEDFCLVDLSDCADCPFPEQLAQW
tara:strand:- start:7623 stop:9032 length:1410 start_codon:yes stop_codon:yes gene_type:complete